MIGDPYAFALKIVKEAGKMILRAREKGFETTTKSGDPRDIVTSVDRQVDEFLAGAIRNAFPRHGIYSEENESAEYEDANQWTVDPIDGSANFSRGIPHFAICVGLLEHSVPIVGAVYNPVTEELFSFKKGGGAFLNGAPIRVSEIADLSQAHVLFHAGRKPEVRDWGGESYRRLLDAAKKTNNFGASSIDACFVAAGRVEASVYGTLSTLDIAPALGILAEAGGVIADVNGEPPVLSQSPQKIFMANSKAMADTLRALIG